MTFPSSDIAFTPSIKAIQAERGSRANYARMEERGGFQNVFVQPAAGNAGTALGAAFLARKKATGNSGRSPLRSLALGPEPASQEIKAVLDNCKIVYKYPSGEEQLLEETAYHLHRGKIVAWCQGRSEFGHRALGNRSILADPRDPKMRDTLNMKIKFREGFRPFAPSVLADKASEWFEIDCDSPYMLLVAPVRKERQIAMTEDQQRMWGIDKLNLPRSDLPAITHIDYSARVQTVARETNPNYHALIQEFERLTGCAVVINTSFNVRGEPIVCTPADAYRCFMRTHIDQLVLGPFLLNKAEQHDIQHGRPAPDHGRHPYGGRERQGRRTPVQFSRSTRSRRRSLPFRSWICLRR